MSALQKIETSLSRLSGGAVSSLPDALRARAETIPDLDAFARHFAIVVDAELSGAYHKFGHGKDVRDSKAFFHVREADFASALIGAAFPKAPIDVSATGFLGAYQADRVEEAVSVLDQEGYYVWPDLLGDETVDQLIALLGDVEFVERGVGVKVDGYDPATAADRGANRVDVASNLSLVQQPLIQQFLLDPMLLDIVQRRLEACPVVTSAHSWWTVGASLDEKELSRAALLFHQDKDWIKWLKAFVYLTDVDEQSGPHVYVKGSHRDYQDRFGEEPKFSSRLSDEEMEKVFGADRICAVTGKRGTLILGDTSAFHRGAPVLQGHRLMMQLEWSCSLFMSPSPALDERVLTSEAQALQASAPRIFANFDHAAREKFVADRSAGKGKGALSKLGRAASKLFSR
ncbi:MAG: phytanoyl-CoA dioxygenase family protein [Neomegalonema sp.]|nr:phytanoyl-CoA dioxygenase family protein [Neomegalonema sp.]